MRLPCRDERPVGLDQPAVDGDDRRGAGEPRDAEPFKLILVDLELPDGNGMELLSELDQYPATKVVTTLYSDDEHLFPALQCGADGYLLKEDRFEVLVEELQKIVRGQPPLSPAIARRLLGHFRQGGRGTPPSGDSGFSIPGDLGGSSRPVPIEKPPEHDRLTPREALDALYELKRIAAERG